MFSGKEFGLVKGDPRVAHDLIPWEHGADDLFQMAVSGLSLQNAEALTG